MTDAHSDKLRSVTDAHSDKLRSVTDAHPDKLRSVTEPTVRMHVGDAVVARVAAQRARRVPGVVALRADLAQALLGLAEGVLRHDRTGVERSGALPTDGVHAAVHGATAEVSITLATRLGYNCRDLAQEVQRVVADEVRAYTGLDVTVRVTVAEVLLD